MQEIRKVLRMIGISMPKTDKLFGIVNNCLVVGNMSDKTVNDY